MRGVAEGRGEPEYLHSKYSEIPTFLRKVGTPPTSLRSATSPMNGGGKSFFDTLKQGPPGMEGLVSLQESIQLFQQPVHLQQLQQRGERGIGCDAGGADDRRPH